MCPPICRFADFFGEPALRTEKAAQDRRAWSGCCSGIRKNSAAASHAEAEFLRIPLPANFRALSRLKAKLQTEGNALSPEAGTVDERTEDAGVPVPKTTDCLK